MKLDFKNPDYEVIGLSLVSFLIGFVVPFGLRNENFFPIWLLHWIFEGLGVAFHEIGHQWIFAPISAVLVSTGIWAPNFGEAMIYLGGFFGNCIAAIALISFAFLLLKKYKTVLNETHYIGLLSFSIIAYANLYLVNYTVAVLTPVVGQGRDFTMASSLLGISLEELVAQMWVVHWIAFAIFFLISFLFIFAKK
ncbi:MAG: hypothetical protein JW772_02095 [Candidatus Diapherotrites archaeon]|nr:hypothetical protein [Candidatus Diapherotrites archaeon]